MPLASVVFPAPRLPISSTTARLGKLAAIRSPTAIVSSSERVSNTRAFTHGLRQEAEQVRRNQRFFSELLCAQFTRAPVEPNRRAHSGLRLLRKLRQESGHQARQNIARA